VDLKVLQLEVNGNSNLTCLTTELLERGYLKTLNLSSFSSQ
jgi:hypothetical protein